MLEAHRRLIEAGLLPEEMPNNYTFNKVGGILSDLDKANPLELNEAIKAASRLEVHGPLSVVIYIKNHLRGRHEVEIDRVTENEERDSKYGVLIYPEGELPINSKYLPDDIQEGSRLQYDPVNGEYTID
ncbi:MAG TPA: hypothetical protein VGC66_15475 [Pyrinomonadaceae bacterium]|jgi:hypothetical protein